MSKVFDILIIDDTRSIHDDIYKTLCPVEHTDEELDALKDDLFGDDDGGKIDSSKALVQSQASFQLQSAYQGKEGYEKVLEANAKDKPYAVAVVDMRMPPGWDGLQTIEEIWKVDKQLQVVICTAYSDYSWNEISERLGHSDRLLILKKPFEPVELHRMVSTLAAKWASEREVAHHIASLDAKVLQRTEELQVAYTELRSEIVERERVEVELRHAQKMEAVGQLAAGVAHEINTPIQFISDSMFFVESLVRDYETLLQSYRESAELSSDAASLLANYAEADEAVEFGFLQSEAPKVFQRVADGLSRVTKIVSAMRGYSHPVSELLSPIDLNEALESALIIAAHEYKYVAEIEKNFQEIPEIKADSSELGQVFINLIVNAAHAIESVVEGTEERGKISVTTVQTEDQVSVSIADTGTGIPLDVQKRIFEPFFTTKPVGRGTGQGLSIAYDIIVRKYGGRIELHSEPGEGSRFDLYLPIAGDANVENKSERGPEFEETP